MERRDGNGAGYMSTLLVDELWDGVQFDQKVKITHDLQLAHIRPWIYKHGTLVDGQFRCSVYQGAILLTTAEIDYADINAAFTEDYAHGNIRFDFDSMALHVADGSTESEYTFRFEMVNHTTDSNNFIGICRQWDLKVYDIYGSGVVDNEPPNDAVEPAGLELYEYKRI